MRNALIFLLAVAALAEEPAKETGLTGTLSEEEWKKLHDLSDEKRPKPAGEMVKVGDMQAYLSLPKGKPPFPAVTVIHEWWGLNEHIKFWADRLAADGYAAVAVDLYEGKVATTRDEAMASMKAVVPAKAVQRLKAAHDFLKSDERVQAKRRASLGWCFGGGYSLQLALAAKDLDASVLYYGRLVFDATELGRIKAKMLGVFGNLDSGIPPADVDRFEKALKEAKVDATILRYDAEHAFANPSGGRYDKEAAEDAWGKVREFLKSSLRE